MIWLIVKKQKISWELHIWCYKDAEGWERGRYKKPWESQNQSRFYSILYDKRRLGVLYPLDLLHVLKERPIKIRWVKVPVNASHYEQIFFLLCS